MRSEFRFPKSTTALMCLILAGVILAIEKATSIVNSLPHDNPRLPPIHPMHSTFAPTFAIMFGVVYATVIVVWLVLFSFKRSGMHRMADLDVEHIQK